MAIDFRKIMFFLFLISGCLHFTFIPLYVLIYIYDLHCFKGYLFIKVKIYKKRSQTTFLLFFCLLHFKSKNLF